MEQQALTKAASYQELINNLDTQYEIDLQLVTQPGQIEQNKNGNRFQKCLLYDGSEKKTVTIWEGRNGQPLQTKNIGQWLTFSLNARKNGRYTNIGGFWNFDAPIVNSAQAPQNAPESKVSYEDREQAKSESICRQTAGKCASEIIAAYINSKPGEYRLTEALNDTLMIADGLSMWFLTGNQGVEEPEPNF